MLTTPAIMIFHEIGEELGNLLWLNELIWFFEIIRKLLFQKTEDQDAYTSAVKYIKSTLILDVLALGPQLFKFMNPSYAVFKNFRLYQISLLHYPATLILQKLPSIEGEHHLKVL